MEFRHDSWFDNEVRDCLNSRNIALYFSHEDEDTAADVERRFAPTASWGYLHLRGTGYDEAELAEFADKIKAQSWDRAFVFFKHEEEGLGPKLAKQFEAATG